VVTAYNFDFASVPSSIQHVSVHDGIAFVYWCMVRTHQINAMILKLQALFMDTNWSRHFTRLIFDPLRLPQTTVLYSTSKSHPQAHNSPPDILRRHTSISPLEKPNIPSITQQATSTSSNPRLLRPSPWRPPYQFQRWFKRYLVNEIAQIALGFAKRIR